MRNLCNLNELGPKRWVVSFSKLLGKLMMEMASNGHFFTQTKQNKTKKFQNLFLRQICRGKFRCFSLWHKYRNQYTTLRIWRRFWSRAPLQCKACPFAPLDTTFYTPGDTFSVCSDPCLLWRFWWASPALSGLFWEFFHSSFSLSLSFFLLDLTKYYLCFSLNHSKNNYNKQKQQQQKNVAIHFLSIKKKKVLNISNILIE